MTEAPKTIHILTSDAVLFAQKYGHPKLELPCVGDVSDAYHHNDTVTALRDKVARLEAALGEIAGMRITCASDFASIALREERIIARNALKETGK